MNEYTKARRAIERGRRGRWIIRSGSRARGFTYTDHRGKAVSDRDTLDRINSLVIPPAWKHVRICPSTGGRIQAVGMDTTGRVQYIYHPKYVAKREREKFAKIERFGEYVPRLREQSNRDIALDGLSKEKVLAVAIRLINSLYFRVGTEGSARRYKTYGLTTLKNEHLTVGRNGRLMFDFVGKSHVQHRKILVDEELASIMRQLKNIGPKRKLFHYLNGEGKPISLKPSDINRYIKSNTDDDFSSKDFRTWGASLLAAIKFAEHRPADDDASVKKVIVSVVKKVAEELGNTPSVCRTSYIHPAVIKAYESGITIKVRHKRRRIDRLAHNETEERELIKLFRKIRRSKEEPG